MVQIPISFLPVHRDALYTYLTDDRQLTRGQWRMLYEAIDILDRAQITIAGQLRTFRQIYREHVEQIFADPYIARNCSVSSQNRHK